MAQAAVGNNVNVAAVLITGESDLEEMTNMPPGTMPYAPGTIAFTAGFKRIWQLSIEGAWVDLLESEAVE